MKLSMNILLIVFLICFCHKKQTVEVFSFEPQTKCGSNERACIHKAKFKHQKEAICVGNMCKYRDGIFLLDRTEKYLPFIIIKDENTKIIEPVNKNEPWYLIKRIEGIFLEEISGTMSFPLICYGTQSSCEEEDREIININQGKAIQATKIEYYSEDECRCKE